MRHIASGMLLLLAATGAILADANDDFERLYGEKARKVTATASTADDATFAAELVKDAKSLGDSPQLQVLLYENACKFGLKNLTGLPHVLKAVDFLVKAQPNKAAEYQAIKLKALEAQYRNSVGPVKQAAGQAYLGFLLERAEAETADGKPAEADKLLFAAVAVANVLGSPKAGEIATMRASIKEATDRAGRIKQWLKILEEKPQDTPTRQRLILLYVLEENKPEEAVKLVTEDVDQALRTCVRQAAKKLEDLPEEACLELARWYESKAKDKNATPAGKATALARAADCYDRYLTVHILLDAARLEARKSLTAVEKLLGAVPSIGKAKMLTLDLGNEITMKLVLIPKGTFTMGSPETEGGRAGNEGPPHPVTITKPFYMGTTEVTQAQYEAVMGKNPSTFKGTENPVDSVSWNDAVEFGRKLSDRTGKKVRLPTEAEWEYACRAGTKTPFSFGEKEADMGDYAWYNSNSGGKTRPVGGKKPNAWGLYDMHGNLEEWCGDSSVESYANPKKVGPQGPAAGATRVLRGGGWNLWPQVCRSAWRSLHDSGTRSNWAGLRVVLDAR
jgi:formylglycine-generating enzyme required for sulfatase activity